MRCFCFVSCYSFKIHVCGFLFKVCLHQLVMPNKFPKLDLLCLISPFFKVHIHEDHIYKTLDERKFPICEVSLKWYSSMSELFISSCGLD